MVGFVAVPVGDEADEALLIFGEVPATGAEYAGAEYAGAEDEGAGAEETMRTGLLTAEVVEVAGVVGDTELMGELV